ncbi:uncharacterized protein DUF552 [Kutzneria buriramensis]|uniref:Uncharacterized protein DUF552 n=1 Tax=Kutzneria buriramensis TaxID=1045776 RepID=A0A3E0HPX1_9PSEU|nr:uncharacterized protein DUF552 [Kutzneria buriramensis]
MNVADTALEYVKVLVWPILIAGILIGFRRTLTRLLGRIIQLDAPGVSAKFDKVANEAEVLSQAGTDAKKRSEISLDDTPRIAPRKYTEAREIGEYYRDDRPVIVDLNKLANEDAKRLVDFMAGLVFHARGSMDKLSNKVFILTPP